MISIIKYCSDQKEIWNNFIDSSKMPMFMFKRGFVEYHSDRFQDCSLMFCNEVGEVIAILPASRHGDELRSHGGLTYGGFITGEKMKQHHMNDCFNSLLKYLKGEGIKTLIYKTIPYIYHTSPAQEDLYPLLQYGQLYRRDISSVISLNNPIKMPKGRKAQISRAKREGVIIKESTDFGTFIALENSVLNHRHHTSAVHTAEELCQLKSRFPNEIRLWIAEYQEKMIAATLLFVYPKVVHTQYMAANDTARKIGGLDYLIKTLIDKYTDTKIYFDFGISTEQAGAVFNEGLCAQKESFGARTVAYDFYKLEI